MRTTSLLCAAALLLLACGDKSGPGEEPTTSTPKLRVEYYEISEK